jgi:hypothetical protein
VERLTNKEIVVVSLNKKPLFFSSSAVSKVKFVQCLLICVGDCSNPLTNCSFLSAQFSFHSEFQSAFTLCSCHSQKWFYRNVVYVAYRWCCTCSNRQ